MPFLAHPARGEVTSVSNKKPSDQSDLSDLTESLAEGIESCRSVIANYKSLLASESSEMILAETEERPDQSAASPNSE